MEAMAFLSTLSLRRATKLLYPGSTRKINFYPRSPCGERRQQPRGTTRTTYFYPRSPCGERPVTTVVVGPSRDFYPRSPCGERPPLTSRTKAVTAISIHALLAESDNLPSKPIDKNEYFYPRSPCGERLRHAVNFHSEAGFLSTLSLRRATAAGVLYVTLII